MTQFLIQLLQSWESVAWAQDAAPAAPQGPSIIEMLLLPAGFFLIMYFFMIRPQQKKAKEHASLLTNLKKGDEIVTSGGIIGRVRSVSEGFVSIDVGGGTTIKVLKSNVAAQTKQPEAKGASQPAKADAKS